jgi:hypothetical protein
MMAAVIAHTRTPAAPVSLAILARGWKLGETRSTIASMAVLKHSAAHTKPIAVVNRAQDKRFSFNQMPIITVRIVATAWMRVFF